MKRFNVKQGGAPWRLLRMGVPTASRADELVTPAKWEPTKSDRRDAYINELIAERFCLFKTKHLESDPEGRLETIELNLRLVNNAAMEWGHKMEPNAVSRYEFLTGKQTREAGLILNDSLSAGASVDREVVGENIGLEIKSPFSLGVYIGYCFKKSVDKAYLPQLMWQMWIGGYEAIEIYAYYPGMTQSEPIRVVRDEEKIKTLAEVHGVFWQQLETRWQEFQSKLQEPLAQAA